VNDKQKRTSTEDAVLLAIVLGLAAGIVFAGFSLIMHFGTTTAIACFIAGAFAGTQMALEQTRKASRGEEKCSHRPGDSSKCRQNDRSDS
jgi:hypothetical protein